MKLTPIRIRGKRRRKGEPAVPKPRKSSRSEVLGRPQKSRRTKASFIERKVPLEVLERIFWFSENVRFPQSSLRLGRLLSEPHTLRQTFIQAFGPTWDVWYGCVYDRAPQMSDRMICSYAGWENDSARFGGNPEFQSSILECTWATVPLILDCWDAWVRRYANQRLFQHVGIWNAPCTADDGDMTHGNARQYFLHDYCAFRQIECQDDTESAVDFQRELNTVTRIEVHKDTQIPDQLLVGPWTDDTLQKLFWLVRAGARLSSEQTWEVTLQGFQNAIIDTYPPSGQVNLTIVRLLDTLEAFKTWPKYIVAEEYSKVDRVCHHNDCTITAKVAHKYAYIRSRLSRFAED
ncbi:hypothetical protein F5Y15DRAFT_252773 [Xylariaceae sp. FL0016]|nr:hypothetical protein F5Y15DRAFT_252773 [Xylariaceae sp. FL0016]